MTDQFRVWWHLEPPLSQSVSQCLLRCCVVACVEFRSATLLRRRRRLWEPSRQPDVSYTSIVFWVETIRSLYVVRRAVRRWAEVVVLCNAGCHCSWLTSLQ